MAMIKANKWKNSSVKIASPYKIELYDAPSKFIFKSQQAEGW